MKTLTSTYGDIDLGNIGEGLIQRITALSPSSIIAVTDHHTAEHCLPLLKDCITIDHHITISPGERYKTIESCQHIWTEMLRADIDRSGLILNVGGGMICDLGGFAASCYKRGVRFAHIPTSLLAMTDAAIGGKTGINHEGYKNLIGRFELPALTWADPTFLNTLPHPYLLDGLAESIKHAIIGSPELWKVLSGLESPKDANWTELLLLSIPVKQRIVEADPLEKGLRKTLNFGHTIGHALESYAMGSDSPLSHGQAVTIGMMAEARMAWQSGRLKNEDFEAIISLIMRLLRPTEVTLPAPEELEYWLQGDKKKAQGILGFSLPDQIGTCAWDIRVESGYITESLNWLSAHLKAR